MRCTTTLAVAALLVLALQVLTLIALFRKPAAIVESSKPPAQLAVQVGRLEQQITETQADENRSGGQRTIHIGRVTVDPNIKIILVGIQDIFNAS